MNAARRTGAFLLLAAVIGATGCATTISPTDFLSKYQTNITVPNPELAKLPARRFLGVRGDWYLLKDYVPSGQGGMFVIGSRTTWRCKVTDLPKDFPNAYRPGDVVFDGLKGTPHAYMIQSYRPPAAPEPAAKAEPPASPPAAVVSGTVAGGPGPGNAR